MKRILMVSTHGYFSKAPHFGLPDTGGQIVVVIELSKGLVKHGYQVDILTRQFEDLPQIEPINNDVRIVRIPCGGRDFIPKEYLIRELPVLIEGFTQYCHDNRLEYQFIDSHYWDAGFVGIKLAENFKIPHVFTPHSLGIWKERNMEEAAVREGRKLDRSAVEREFNYKERNDTEKIIMQSVYRVIATTPQQQDIIRDDYGIPDNKIAVIPPGFDADKYHIMTSSEVQEVRNKFKLPPRFVLSVGRIASNKAYDLLVKAMKPVIDSVPDVNLVFAIGSQNPTDAEKEQKEVLRKLSADLGIEERVLFHGHVSELEQFYNAAEIFVMPSVYEPFGMVAIEAMACGTPAVVTDKSGLKYFLHNGEDAQVVDPIDTDIMASSITSLLKDKKKHSAMGKKGYKTAMDNFTWEMIARKTLDTVSDL